VVRLLVVAGPAAAATRPGLAAGILFRPEGRHQADEFGTHYAEVATFHKTFTEQQAALAARKPEDIKIEVKLPDTVKVPDGMELKIDPKDPRVPLRAMAIKNGWSQEQVNDLVNFDAQQQIAAHAAEQTRVAAEKQKLGANGDDRLKAPSAWVKGVTTDAAELGEVQVLDRDRRRRLASRKADGESQRLRARRRRHRRRSLPKPADSPDGDNAGTRPHSRRLADHGDRNWWIESDLADWAKQLEPNGGITSDIVEILNQSTKS
jgi:hypothetical protein